MGGMDAEMVILLLTLEGLFWLCFLKPPAPLYREMAQGLLEAMHVSAAPQSRWEQYLG